MGNTDIDTEIIEAMTDEETIDKENDKYYRILNLEGKSLIKDDGAFTYSTTAKRKFISKDKDGNKIEKAYTPDINRLYSATMPYSLETLRAFNKYPNEIIDMDDEQGTKLFINFKFTKDMIEDSEDDTPSKKTDKKKLRKLIYTSKVIIDKVEYCYFKRGASKARTSSVIFCKKECYDTLFNPCLLGLEINDVDEYDITSLSAYISLIMSGIIGTLEIKPEEILIINDIMSPVFKATQSLTKYYDDNINIDQIIKESDVSNNCTDGQVLLDESAYLENDLLETATCALLRNDFFKGNAVRTRLQEYWKINEITEVWDMYRGWISTDKIRLVVTPSSCKYLKFADQFESEKECFLNWLKNIPSTFGVVKKDKIGTYSYSNRLSYQMLNSMNVPLDILETEIMKDELDYYKLLKDNTLVTSTDRKKLSKKNKANNLAIRNDMAYFLNHISNPDNDDTCTKDMITDLLSVNSDFRFVKQFKDWKKDQLRDYVNNLRLGKIRIQNSIYAIMICCPFEMLVATTVENNIVETSIMKGWEMYCPNFDKESELLVIRNPQINAGNIGCFINQWHEEFKWFGYYKDGKPMHEFVTFINSWDVDTMNRLQGCDWDIDTCFLTDSTTLVNYAKESQTWATPTNGISGKTEPKQYNLKNLSELDNYLGGSTKTIGEVVNKSCIYNSYMYHGINNGFNQDYVEKCYKVSSTLSSFSQLAIDMAKKSFGKLLIKKEMNLLNKTTYINDNGEKEQILKYDYDRRSDDKKLNVKPDEVKIKAFIKDYLNSKNNDNYIPQYQLINPNELDMIVELMDKDEPNISDEAKLDTKVKVYARKTIVPYFFNYIAKDNSHRIPTKMDCTMDYLEEILDNLVTKAIGTDKVDIKDLFKQQKELEGKAFNRVKIDKARVIIDKCQSVLDKNYYDKTDNDKESEDKARLRKWAKKTAIKELGQLKLNGKTVYRVLLRAFDLDIKYQGNIMVKLDNDNEDIFYTDKKTGETKQLLVQELKEMNMLVLSLLYKSYPETLKNSFIEKRTDLPKVKRFWK